MKGIHRSPNKGPVTRKIFPFHICCDFEITNYSHVGYRECTIVGQYHRQEPPLPKAVTMTGNWNQSDGPCSLATISKTKGLSCAGWRNGARWLTPAPVRLSRITGITFEKIFGNQVCSSTSVRKTLTQLFIPFTQSHVFVHGPVITSWSKLISYRIPQEVDAGYWFVSQELH